MNIEKHVDTIYLASLRNIMGNGVTRKDRTGVGTRGVFGTMQRYDLREGFPLLTTKKVYTRGVLGELLFFLTGRTDNNWLNERKINIWNEWAAEDGDLGPIYGYQWRHFGAEYVPQADRDAGVNPGGVDQIAKVLDSLKSNPFSRRHIVTAWSPAQVDEMALPPCHTLFQFYVTPDENGAPKWLSGQLYQRSMDTFLGQPFNIPSYAALLHLFADLVGLEPLEFVHTAGDAHIYLNHFDQVQEQLSREPELRPMPTLSINHPVPVAELDLSDPRIFEAYKSEDFIITGYNPHPAIKAPIAV